MIIITGIGRCGTSVLAEYCKRVGADIGKGKWVDKYRAGNEDIDTVSINDTIYKYGISEDVEQRIKEINCFAIKDPMFLRDLSIIRGWWKARQDLKIVVCTRNYREIVESQLKVPEMMAPVYRTNIRMMRDKEKQFLYELAKLRIDHEIIRFPNFLTTFDLIDDILFGNKDAARKQRKKIWDDLVKL